MRSEIWIAADETTLRTMQAIATYTKTLFFKSLSKSALVVACASFKQAGSTGAAAMARGITFSVVLILDLTWAYFLDFGLRDMLLEGLLPAIGGVLLLGADV